jgi:hypothetical protein
MLAALAFVTASFAIVAAVAPGPVPVTSPVSEVTPAAGEYASQATPVLRSRMLFSFVTQ